jgi:hypothetical protein
MGGVLDSCCWNGWAKAGGKMAALRLHIGNSRLMGWSAPGSGRHPRGRGSGPRGVQRGGMRVATTYALTWLPLHDGTPASNRWRLYRNPDLAPLAQPKARNLPSEGEADCGNLPHEGEAALPSEGEADGPNLPSEGEADGPKNLPHEGEALLREDSYQGRGDRFRSIHGAAAEPCPVPETE